MLPRASVTRKRLRREETEDVFRADPPRMKRRGHAAIQSTLPMNRRMCRQVLDCGDGVREVTALAVKLLKTPKRAADLGTTTQSGDSEDSVAAVQDAGATNPPPCGSWSRGAILGSWRLPMNLVAADVSPLTLLVVGTGVAPFGYRY